MTSEVQTARPGIGPGRVLALALAVLLNVALVLGIGWLLTHRERVIDQFAVWNFSPSTQLSEYASRAAMSDEGRFLFYASTPRIAAGTAFDDACATHQEGVGILGCYLPGDRTIHLFDVTDPRLDGLEEVVAAHEMLHAAWDRMTAADHDTLGPLLEAEVAKRQDDTALADTLAFYAASEPGERLNELHSIIGTEYSGLSPALEAHFAQYFTDRGAVTALHETSNAVFVQQAKQVADLVAQLDALAGGIDADYAAYNSGYDQLGADVAAFNSRAQSAGFTSQTEFQQERGALLARQAELDALYESIAARKAQYTDLAAQLDALNAVGEQLNKSINIAPRDSTGVDSGG
ncbi:hypothetical protein BH11ACT4_BH11ACT4_22890 [soil metagenome]